MTSVIAFSQIQPRRFFQKLPLQANFYPMPSMAYIQDSQYRLTLHTAQALGVSSLASGENKSLFVVNYQKISSAKMERTLLYCVFNVVCIDKYRPNNNIRNKNFCNIYMLYIKSCDSSLYEGSCSVTA